MESILVTGAAGFIGAFLCKRLLLNSEARIIGLDNMNSYYDVGIKRDRLRMIHDTAGSDRFDFVESDIADEARLSAVFEERHPSFVVNLAAQAGVRHSIDNPRAYVESNLIGFFNILEACRNGSVEHLVFASSSSVYGDTSSVPYSVDSKTDHPVSFYAATKKSNELMAHSYSKLYGIPCTGLRFFTAYGPMGRPDMAYFKFTDRIVRGEPIQIYNNGNMERDFTYIEDIVTGIDSVMKRPPAPCESGAPFKVYNIGNGKPIQLKEFVETLGRMLLEEGVTDKHCSCELLPMQPGDVHRTCADTSDLERDFGFRPSTELEDGLRAFIRWYKRYYRL